MQTDETEAEGDDARAVRRDCRPVARHPQSARRVAVVIRQLRQKDGSRAAVEPRLQPGRVVTPGAAGGWCRRSRACGRRDRPSPAREERPAAVAAKPVLCENDLALAVVLSTGDHDAGAAAGGGLPRIPGELVADEVAR